MKKLMVALLLLLTALVIPFSVKAEEEPAVNEVKIYFFRGEGCSHCAETEEWFQEIEEEYGSKFIVVDYETWYNQDNATLMQQVAEARGEEAEGVPYIIIGNKSWNGFTDSYKSEILAQIDAEYSKDASDRYDIMKLLPSLTKKAKKESSAGSDIIALIVILAAVGGICFGVYKARSKVK